VSPILLAALGAVVLLFGCVRLYDIGRKLGVRRQAADPEGADQGMGAVEGAVFGLMGLLLAFTFSGASERFETRISLVTTEANAVGTAWQRLDLLPEPARASVQKGFRTYVQTRLAGYALMPDREAANKELDRAEAMGRGVWTEAVEAVRAPEGTKFAPLVLPALNEAFDMAQTRAAATHNHPPTTVFVLLAALILLSALLAGHATAKAKMSSRLHVYAFAALLSLTFYLIVDIEYPRFGLIKVTEVDHVLQAEVDKMR
jgi:hypothetical protein